MNKTRLILYSMYVFMYSVFRMYLLISCTQNVLRKWDLKRQDLYIQEIYSTHRHVHKDDYDVEEQDELGHGDSVTGVKVLKSALSKAIDNTCHLLTIQSIWAKQFLTI